MRTGHLFAGAGGGLYADLILGHRPVFAVEWDDYAAGVLQRRADDGWFPGLHVHHGDVQLFDPSDWTGRVDSIHAGFPCQDISTAGNGAGIEGERSGLWKEVKRVAGVIRPRELFLENSPAISTRGLGTVLGDLAELGFDARWCVLPASAAGAPHLRARWWCLARRADADHTEQRPGSRGRSGEGSTKERNNSRRLCREVSNSDSQQLRDESGRRSRQDREDAPITGNDGQAQLVANTGRRGQSGRGTEPKHSESRSRGQTPAWWSVEPNVGRVADGVANRVNRIKCLGNGQVPLQAAAAYTLLSTQFNK
ncbi:DNA cytosine methyltransferase [Pseudomaricurvus alkylphenolicus]|uniref:DNA cytosine methyltransferase n=1 Tax=Pseudomaricurvus alkylphenolicus TaxID=1306991 RepID=UPI001421B078|nr:DNA cytosine methyltransferase [Pseudomaricurvus alkylphenolicus]